MGVKSARKFLKPLEFMREFTLLTWGKYAKNHLDVGAGGYEQCSERRLGQGYD